MLHRQWDFIHKSFTPIEQNIFCSFVFFFSCWWFMYSGYATDHRLLILGGEREWKNVMVPDVSPQQQQHSLMKAGLCLRSTWGVCLMERSWCEPLSAILLQCYIIVVLQQLHCLEMMIRGCLHFVEVLGASCATHVWGDQTQLVVLEELCEDRLEATQQKYSTHSGFWINSHALVAS